MVCKLLPFLAITLSRTLPTHVQRAFFAAHNARTHDKKTCTAHGLSNDRRWIADYGSKLLPKEPPQRLGSGTFPPVPHLDVQFNDAWQGCWQSLCATSFFNGQTWAVYFNFMGLAKHDCHVSENVRTWP